MFTIIGGDGKEYGPATTEQIRSWIAAGRASLDTKARAAGSEELRRLGDYAEFSAPDGPPPLAVATPVAASLAPDAASLGARFGGALIDGILKTLCWLPTMITFWRTVGPDLMAGRQPAVAEVMAAMNGAVLKSIPFLLALAVVQCCLISIRSQSVGKILVGTRIVRHRDGTHAGFIYGFLLRGTIPWVIEQIPLLGGLFWIVNACFIFGTERRCVHDYIAGTRVIRA